MKRFNGSAPHVTPYSIHHLELSTWFERDRAHVCLSDPVTGDTIVEWLDEAVHEAVEDGYLDPRDWKGSAFAYAQEMGLIV